MRNILSFWSGTFASAFGDVEASLFVAGAAFAVKFGREK